MGAESKTDELPFFKSLFNPETKSQKEARLGYFLIFPTVALVTGVILYPILYNLWLSLTKVSLGPSQGGEFVGLANYIDVVSDPQFWGAMGTTLIYTVTTVAGATLLGLAVALLLNREFIGRALARGVVLLPYVVPIISIVFAWKYLFNPVFGMANFVLVDVLHLLENPVNWVESPQYALWMAIFFEIWRAFPFAFLMIIAKLQSIPKTYYEAAEIDGANWWQKTLKITLPQLKFVIASLALLRWIWNFNKFSEVYLLSKQVNVVSVYAYEKAFSAYQHGQGAAISATLFLILISFVLLYVKKVLKW
ncbi:carbohydrate ABC transporter permease [Halanaerobacter jeridensis]|uniref:Multiple sugar transport system permease protein n=1 Tax=Halanaerobacter jeridensis TaxID=706427 RepID=A0A938XSR2_9FIRM|nr:sugar ABC transporter permease [Halanaerobacter jeridensis]MBM7557026.1 multiple sugar transport system permease protein [Halanaerobacter jeridensis]